MSRYFMGDTRLAGLERMMMDPSRPVPSRTGSRQKGRRKKMPHSRPAKPRKKVKEEGV